MLLRTFPIFCINLDRDRDKWRQIDKQFTSLNQKVIRFPASEGEYLTDGDLPLKWDRIDCNYYHHETNPQLSRLEFKPGVVGCALSHYRLWKFAVKNKIKFFCVVEDDIQVNKRLQDITCPDEFDILYISDRIIGNSENLAIDGVGTEGYILSFQGAKKLLKICEDLSGPIDYRVQAHIKGFIKESSQNRECLLFHSFTNKEILVDGYKSPDNYVCHSPIESRVDKKYTTKIDNPLLTQFITKKNVVFIPFNNEINIIFDKRPNFITVVMCFSRENPTPTFPYLIDYFCAVPTECKGDLMQNQIIILNDIIKEYNFVAMYDDDIKIKVSEIEKLFEIAQEENLDLFAPSLSHDSYYTYDITLNKGSGVRSAEWVEIMMPHFSKRFIEQFKIHLKSLSEYNLKTSYGFDLFLFPQILKEIGGHCAIVDDIIAKHNREITSDKKIFSNGLTALQEMNLVENYVNALKKQDNPHLENINYGKIKIKICVNSTKNYSEKTLPVIIPSLIESGIDPEDIFVFEGGHNQRSVLKKDTYTLIQTDNNTLDLTGLIDIVENELESDYWFYLHDTCKVGPKFKELLYNIPESLPDKIALIQHPSMNIGSYKYSCLMRHKDKLLKYKNYDYSEKKLKKLKEWCIYCEDLILHKSHQTGTYIDTIDFYNKERSDCIEIENQNWYQGVKRIIEYYPQLDLYKSKANYHRKNKPIVKL